MSPQDLKRTLADHPTMSASGNKKPRFDLEEQMNRASTLFAQLQDGVKNNVDSKTSASNQIATNELMQIFESMKEKTVE